MTAAQAVSTPTLPSTAASAGNRAVQQDGQGSTGAGWQRALETASQDVQAPSALAAEAGYLMALNNLDATPMENLALPAASSPATVRTPQDRVPALDGDIAQRPAEPLAHSPGVRMQREAKASPAATSTAAEPIATGTHADPVRTPPSSSGAFANGPAASRGEHPSASQQANSVETGHPVAETLPHIALAPLAAHAIASYATAMSSAHASTQATTDFTVASRSTPMPVHVHVQWRERVADVWIGLHRQAFDQLPDIRAGVEDWVTSRGGVLGRVVCNGETLTRIAPSSHFLGAL